MTSNNQNQIPSAYLIVSSEVFKINRELTKIGRKLDNHIVLNDPRISRNHAQIRIVEGQFVIFDLNSTGGIYVNGNKVSKSVLYSGDLISLAGLMMKFAQDTPRMFSKSLNDTTPLTEHKFEEIPTQIIDKQQNPSSNDEE